MSQIGWFSCPNQVFMIHFVYASSNPDLLRCGISLSFQLFPNVPDQVFEKIPAFPAAPARAGRVHDRLRGIRAAADGILDHAVGDVPAMTCFFPAIHRFVPPEKPDAGCYAMIPFAFFSFKQGRYSWFSPSAARKGNHLIILNMPGPSQSQGRFSNPNLS